jgi:hypothetical protein
MNHCQITVKNILNDDDDDDDAKLSFLYFDLIFLQNFLFHFTEQQGLTEHTVGKYWSISSQFEKKKKKKKCLFDFPCIIS